MTQYKLTAIACLAVLMFGLGRASPQDQQQNKPDPSTESGAYQAAHDESDARSKIKLLDDFAARYPDSAQMPDAYRDYYATYFSLEDYPRAIQYADKLVGLGDKVDLNSRILALLTREVAYFADCNDPALRTPEAYTQARDAGKEGLRMLGQWLKPENLTDDQFASEKKSFEIILSNVAAMGESGLEGRPVSCLAPKLPPGANLTGNDGRVFNRMIKDILEQQRQSPRVR